MPFYTCRCGQHLEHPPGAPRVSCPACARIHRLPVPLLPKWWKNGVLVGALVIDVVLVLLILATSEGRPRGGELGCAAGLLYFVGLIVMLFITIALIIFRMGMKRARK